MNLMRLCDGSAKDTKPCDGDPMFHVLSDDFIFISKIKDSEKDQDQDFEGKDILNKDEEQKASGTL